MIYNVQCVSTVAKDDFISTNSFKVVEPFLKR